MNEIIGNIQPLAVVNPPMRKVVDLSESKRERAEEVAKGLGQWLGDQGFKVEVHGRVVDSNGPPTEIQNRIGSWFGHSEHEPTFSDEKVLVEYDETFDKQYNPPRGLLDPHRDEKEIIKKKIFVRIEDDDFGMNTKMVTVQAEGYPATTGFVEGIGDTSGIGGTYEDVYEVAKQVVKEVQDSNPDAEVVFVDDNPAYRLPKPKGAAEQTLAGMVGVKLSQLPPPVPTGNPDANTMIGNPQEIAVCCEPKLGCSNPPEHTDIRVKCDICGEMIANEDEIIHHFMEKHPEDPRVKAIPNRHYTAEERDRIMRTPEFRSWLRAWKAEKKKRPKQGYFHAFMSDVGHKAFAHSPKKWPSAVRYSDKDSVEVPKKRKHYIQVGQKKRTIRGVKRIKPISNPGDENMEVEGRMVYENPKTMSCPYCGETMTGDYIEGEDIPMVGWHCKKCGWAGETSNPKDKTVSLADLLYDPRRGKKYGVTREEFRKKLEEENPKDKSWLMERRKKFRYPTGADSTHPPAAHSREKFWVRGHKRGVGMFADGTPVRGHYRAANPDDEKESIGSLALDNPPEHQHTFKFIGMCNPVKGGKSQKLFKCVECGKTFVENK